jgi:hypothetical protein
VLDDLPQNARHVRGTPCKHVSVGAEEVDEHCFLFGVERSADLECLAIRVIGAERDKLNLFCWLEATGMAFGTRDFLGESLQIGSQCSVQATSHS